MASLVIASEQVEFVTEAGEFIEIARWIFGGKQVLGDAHYHRGITSVDYLAVEIDHTRAFKLRNFTLHAFASSTGTILHAQQAANEPHLWHDRKCFTAPNFCPAQRSQRNTCALAKASAMASAFSELFVVSVITKRIAAWGRVWKAFSLVSGGRGGLRP
jgi:hypothetical protein